VAYRDELASLLDALETKAHDSDQIDRWVAWLSAAGYSELRLMAEMSIWIN
jgi:hypothetical protein